MARPIEEAFHRHKDDYRWLGAVHECPKCGSNLFRIIGGFHERRISHYFTTMQCAVCNVLLTAPTEAD